jgi:regulator of chromosome condensation (RCC1) repeat-containing protein
MTKATLDEEKDGGVGTEVMLKRSFVLAALALSLGTVASCGGDDDAPPTKLAEPCHANSDCGGSLICALGRCHEVCVNSKDCPAGQRCVKTEMTTACQLPLESKCTYDTDCIVPLVCGIDRNCRNMCQGDRDCLTGQFCDVSLTCADRTEVPDGSGLPDNDGPKRPDAGGGSDGAGGMSGAGGAAGAAGMGGAGGQAGMAGAGGSTPDAGGDVSVDMSVDTSSDRAADTSSNPDSISPDAGCGHVGEACCASGSACVLGATCDTNNMCIACGQRDQACCAGASACLVANLDCVSGTCQCGAQSQVCCGGTTCNTGLTCSGGGDAGKPTCGCGGNAQACCANSMCSNGTLSCAGAKCTCVTGCFADRYQSDVHVLRSDGTAWYYTGYSVMPAVVADASMVPVTGFTKLATGYQFSCGIKADKTAWCWWNTAGGTTASYGQLGDGTTVASHAPVQVVTAVSGPGLANVIDISTYSNTTCAVVSDGGVYCWGYGAYGQLGIGTKPSYSAYAVPVVTAISGPAFTGADQVSVGQYHACAHKTDNTIWCWGYNNYGQVGNGGTMEQLVPVYVSALSNQANQVAVGANHSCARSGDTVWCWGYNGSGLGDGMTTSSPTPIQVLATMGGAAFSGVGEIRSSSAGTCALRTADKSVWCWGGFSPSSQTPVNVSPAGFPVSSVYYWDALYSSLCFARTDAELYIGNAKATYPVACP